MKKGKGKFHRTKGWGFIYVSADVCKDSAFPFTDKDDLIVTVTDNKVEVTKSE